MGVVCVCGVYEVSVHVESTVSGVFCRCVECEWRHVKEQKMRCKRNKDKEREREMAKEKGQKTKEKR